MWRVSFQQRHLLLIIYLHCVEEQLLQMIACQCALVHLVSLQVDWLTNEIPIQSEHSDVASNVTDWELAR